MSKQPFDQLEQTLSILGKDAYMSSVQKQAIRDKVFKKIGQLDLIDSMQTKTESMDLIMPLKKLQDIFRPRRVMLSLPATLGLVATVFIATFTTGAIARTAEPGDPLFGVRKALETVQVALVSDPAQKAALKLSIANERVQGLENVDPAKLEAVLNESKKALASAQTSVAALKDADGAASIELLNKLKELVTNQQSIVSTIIKENVDNEEIKKSVVAVRDELDKILPEDIRKPAEEEPAEPVAQTIFYGSIVTAYGQPALNSGGVIYLLRGAEAIDINKYIGQPEKVRVDGRIIENPTATMQWGIAVREITVASKLIFENQDYIANDSPRVEDSQN
ncbi:MAG: DUF5667 domain-containing protein [Patescibacteria group bacterium]|nr:DUF5667 domain-containing protein [Patescibacteria group bacterium]